jgi:ATP-binding cassette subfamily A (ABC1) protein 3
MLVGLVAPTSGDVVMPGGLKLSSDLSAIRQHLGVCPQHDILYPELTVLDHLRLFAAIKGVRRSREEVEAAVVAMAAEVGLAEKADVASAHLSGGQKRKLSLGMALIGDSRTIILDGE